MCRGGNTWPTNTLLLYHGSDGDQMEKGGEIVISGFFIFSHSVSSRYDKALVDALSCGMKGQCTFG